MSFRVVGKVLRRPKESMARRLILIVLAESAHDDGITWVSQEAIATKACVSRGYVNRLIGEMETEGILETRKAQRGKRRISVYRLVLDGLDDPEYDALPFELDAAFTTSTQLTSSPSHDVHSVAFTTSTQSPAIARARSSSLKSKMKSKKNSSALARRSEDLESPNRIPATVTIDGQNIPFNALVEVTQADPDVEGGRIAKALQTIRKVCWRDLPEGAKAIIDAQTFDQAVAGSIRERAAMYERKYPDVDLTPTALAHNWSRVTKGQPHRGGPADIALRNMRERGGT